MDAKNGREVLKFALPPKTLRHYGIPLTSICLSLESPSVLPLTRATSSHMGGRYASLATPQDKLRSSSEIVATLPEGAAGKGKVGAATNLTTTTS